MADEHARRKRANRYAMKRTSQDGTKARHERGRRTRGTEEMAEVGGPVHVGTRPEDGRCPDASGEMVAQRVEQRGGLPRKRSEGVGLEGGAGEANQVRAAASCGAQHGRSGSQPIRNGLPVDLMQARAIATHRDDVFVALRKGFGDGVGEALTEGVATLLRSGDLQHRQSARVRRFSGVAVQRLGHVATFGSVAWHKALGRPLPHRAVAEEQQGGMGRGEGDGAAVGKR